VPLPVIYEVVVPLLGVRNTAITLTSTVTSRHNYFSLFSTLKDADGEPIFAHVSLNLVCKRCLGTENERFCKHKTLEMPEWKDEDAVEMMRTIFGTANSSLQKREILGIEADDEAAAFGSNQLDRLFTRKPHGEPHGTIGTIYMGFDPNGGGVSTTGSHTALVAFFYDGPMVVICALAHHGAVDHHESWALVEANVVEIRKRPCLRQAHIVFIPEYNIGNDSQFVSEQLIDRFDRVSVLSTHANYFGVITSGSNKHKFVRRMNDKLTDEAIVYHKDVISANPFAHADKRADEVRAEARREFEQGLIAFQKTATLTPTSHETRYQYKGVGARDDLTMAIMIGLFFSGIHRNPPHRLHERGKGNRLITQHDREHVSFGAGA